MAPGRRPRMDGDVLADGGTRLSFDAIPEADGADAHAREIGGRVANWAERAKGALAGAALAAAWRAAPALLSAADEGGVAGAFALALAPARWLLAALLSRDALPDADAVDHFLADVDLPHHADAFRAMGYHRAEDFFGITERELADELNVTFAAHRRRIVLHADRLRDASERGSLVSRAIPLVAAACAACLFVFFVALCLDVRLRSLVGSYVGIAGAVAWYWGKKYLEERRERRERRGRDARRVVVRRRVVVDEEEEDPTTTKPNGAKAAAANARASGARDASRRRRAARGGDGEAGSGTDDDDSAFEGSRRTSPGSSPTQPEASACARTEEAATLLARWNRERMFVEAREELAAWRLSREAFPHYEEELAKLKAAVPRSEIPDVVAPMVIGGDWDAFYRRFLSAQNGKAAKAEKMLRGMIEWRSGLDLEGKMRVWSSIPDETKDSTFEGYQSGWYTAETAIGCPVYIERTGTLNLGEVLKHVSADDIVDHHLRVMEWMLRVLMPAMAKREGTPAPDKIINLLDMKGLSMRVLGRASLSIFKRVLAIDQNYFPEVMYRCYIVNCPVAFRAVWSVVRPMLDKRIQKKIKIYGRVTGKAMDEMVAVFGGEDRVPAFIGGGCERSLKQCPPWGLSHMDDDEFVYWETPVRNDVTRGEAPASADERAADAPSTPA